MRKQHRIRIIIAALLLAASPTTVACNQEQIQGVINSLTVSFEEGGAEGAFWDATSMVLEAGAVLGIPIPYP